MDSYLPQINATVALGAILLQLFCVFVLLHLIFKKNSKVTRFVSDHVLFLCFFISLASVLISLFYSNVVGYPPCTLCWYQRIFMYPLALLFGFALYKRDRSILPFIYPFVILGIVFSLYHYYIELGGSTLIPCSSTVPCARRYIFEFGFITIPLMAFTGFFSILLGLLCARKQSRQVK